MEGRLCCGTCDFYAFFYRSEAHRPCCEAVMTDQNAKVKLDPTNLRLLGNPRRKLQNTFFQSRQWPGSRTVICPGSTTRWLSEKHPSPADIEADDRRWCRESGKPKRFGSQVEEHLRLRADPMRIG
jgi:hypothetical protein